MTQARDILVPIFMIAAMTLVVLGLMRLTAPEENISNAHDDIAETTAAPRSDRIKTMAANWSGDIAWGASYPALTPFSEAEDASTTVQFDSDDDYWGLPRSEGVETVAAFCGSCHSLAIVMQQRQTREGWDYLLNWMTEKQRMAAPPPEIRAEIIDYLSREFATE